MRIRKAGKADFPQVRALATSYNLDYDHMESDDYWVAAEGRRIVGICGLKKHPDCWELCSLAVEPLFRGKNLGRELVGALLKATEDEIFLTTVIPGYFEKLGFEAAVPIPPSMVKPDEWCVGCRRDLCRALVKRR